MWSHVLQPMRSQNGKWKRQQRSFSISRAQMMLRGLSYGNPTATFSSLSLETFCQLWVMFSCSSVSLFHCVCNSPYYEVISLVSKWDCSTFNPRPFLRVCCREGPSCHAQMQVFIPELAGASSCLVNCFLPPSLPPVVPFPIPAAHPFFFFFFVKGLFSLSFLESEA